MIKEESVFTTKNFATNDVLDYLPRMNTDNKVEVNCKRQEVFTTTSFLIGQFPKNVLQ